MSIKYIKKREVSAIASTGPLVMGEFAESGESEVINLCSEIHTT